MRLLLLCLPLAVFLVYAHRDNTFHFKGRRVTRGEHLLHAVLGMCLIGLVTAAFRSDLPMLTLFGAVFAVAGGIDEFGYHRDLPVEEVDLHAKEHLSLMLFLLAAWVTA